MYPSPLAVSSRKLTDNIVLSVTGFKRMGRVNFGARMALFRLQDSVVVWSAIPFSDDVNKALELLTGQAAGFNVTHLIVPDSEHTMAAASFKQEFPRMKIIAMEGVQLGKGVSPDYVVTSKYGNKKIDAETLREIGVQEPQILDNFEFVYLPSHGNKELVAYHKESKAVFEADMLFNLRTDVPMEQFSPATGFPENYYPFSGMSFLAKFLNADSKTGRFLFRKMVNTKASAEGLQAINAWDFDTLVMCHGNVIEKGGKAAFQKVFLSVLN
ncbi:hypothetical protein METBIDRAFT_41237 [Metschnikowia bicuspidata var. bicuspidata NRRL YB-4993]|uniref:Metallo-beta-lactamase domain-containing protein n=1 Tax=Metschnikowia bicuspidata var. bicuspidata NRRL YB-4993 TaxID=869754 RepID=A0A1A0HBY5_9ASCO|nr:hypothetical protein METBIDRAFT_41237 [Metschnikowia bicuspidata var. bicuspidata NRRL YB-4993]OBA21649.1 hypothetical protein METBIDRAFT_41237 [Metschnikowia bicuspidata var. bicuspidata NRRL YB-4993]